jgi:hypothetical protein
MSLGGFGFANYGTTPRSERLICANPSETGTFALFADGKEKDLEIGMVSGSVQVAGLLVTVTGAPK